MQYLHTQPIIVRMMNRPVWVQGSMQKRVWVRRMNCKPSWTIIMKISAHFLPQRTSVLTMMTSICAWKRRRRIWNRLIFVLLWVCSLQALTVKSWIRSMWTRTWNIMVCCKRSAEPIEYWTRRNVSVKSFVSEIWKTMLIRLLNCSATLIILKI